MEQVSPVSCTAGTMESGIVVDSDKQFITFRLGAQEYGVDIMVVREIKGWSETTAIPNAPHFIRGVINLRGIIVPIMDLRARFGMELTEQTQTNVVIIIITGARTTGLLVDAVSDIISVEPTSIRPIPQLGSGAHESLLTGLVALDNRMVSLVSLEGLIGNGDLRLAVHVDAMLKPAA